MLDSQPSSNPESSPKKQNNSKEIDGADFAEEYFASLSGPARRLIQDVVAVREAYEDVWTGLEVSEQEKIIDENIIQPETILRYERSPAKVATNCVRLSSFGVEKVFPRLQIQTGKKVNSFLDDNTGSQGEDLGSDCTYSYRDEHSAPWGWMTRSQQELRFDSGHPESFSSDELAENGLETVTASPSRILNRQSMLIRQSKGNPLYAKPVQIPVVPDLPKFEPEPPEPEKISPHKINNFVYQDENRIVLDFGSSEPQPEVMSPSEEFPSAKTNLLSKMKTKTSTLRKSLSNVSNGGTLRRKKSQKSINNVDDSSPSPTSTLSAVSSITQCSTNNSSSQKNIVKPSCAPPPPPVTIVEKSKSLPRSSNEPNMTQSLYLPAKKSADDIVQPLEDFKIDLNTQSDIPKTGFDFLDNW